jgi:pyridoxal 5'-phosphate synthase pdxS subunit
MALERVPADIRRDGGVARMSDPELILGIQAAVSIPVMAKARIGHFYEARVLEALDVDYIDESEVLTPADEDHHIDKWAFTTPFVCGAKDLGEALRRIGEGAAMIRTKGEAGTGNVVEAVRHMRKITGDIRWLTTLRRRATDDGGTRPPCPLRPRQGSGRDGTSSRSSTSPQGVSPRPSDAALMMALGVDGVFVGSGIFKSSKPDRSTPEPSWTRPPTGRVPRSWPRCQRVSE